VRPQFPLGQLHQGPVAGLSPLSSYRLGYGILWRLLWFGSTLSYWVFYECLALPMPAVFGRATGWGVGYFQGIVLGSLPFSWRMHLYCVWMLRSMMMSGSMRPSVIVPTTMRPSPISSPRRNCIASRVAANLVLAVRGARRYVLLLLPVQWYIVRRYYAPIWSGLCWVAVFGEFVFVRFDALFYCIVAIQVFQFVAKDGQVVL